jgi:hypothetical protein
MDVPALEGTYREEASTKKPVSRTCDHIYIGLRDLLPFLDIKGSISREENRANLPGFVKAECFNAAKSSPLFWQLRDAVAIVKVHEHFGFLAISKHKDVRSAAMDVNIVLQAFRGAIDSHKLSRPDLLEGASGQIAETELTLNAGSETQKVFDRLRHWKVRRH